MLLHRPKLFWPFDIQQNPGVAYGFVVEKTLVAVGVLPTHSVEVATAVITQICWHKEWREFSSLLGNDLRVLGEWKPGEPLKVLVPGFATDELYLVHYRRPRLSRMRFYSLEPLELDITTKKRGPPPVNDFSFLMDQLHRLDFTQKTVGEQKMMSIIVNQINYSLEIDRLATLALSHKLPRPATPSSREPRLSLPPSLVSVASSVALLITAMITSICNIHVPWLVSSPLLKDVSATIQQIDVRVEQMNFLPSQLRLIRRRKRDQVAFFSAQYISFYNCIWLILNDAILGSAFGTFLCENSEVLGAALASRTEMITVQAVQSTLLWLDNWPVGLKLNTELSRFLCLLFLALTDLWADCLQKVGPYFPTLLFVIGISGRLGLTMMLSLSSDLLSLLTIHMYMCYLIATAIFAQLRSTTSSLWNLFRGKRWNALRQRTDSWDYDVDQLLLGTILFTLVAFLAPTAITYYLVFALSRLGIITIHAMLETVLTFINHFPLFATVLRLKESSRLPGGIYFDIKSSSAGPVLTLKNLPIPFSRIFFQHLLVWSRVSAHYNPIRLLKCLASASFITPIPKYSIRYNMIPYRRESVD